MRKFVLIFSAVFLVLLGGCDLVVDSLLSSTEDSTEEIVKEVHSATVYMYGVDGTLLETLAFKYDSLYSLVNRLEYSYSVDNSSLICYDYALVYNEDGKVTVFNGTYLIK